MPETSGSKPTMATTNPSTRNDPAFAEYVKNLPEIYQDILRSFPATDPYRKIGFGLAIQTVHVALDGKYSLGILAQAINEMEKHGAVTISHGIFVHPTTLGESIIAQLTGHSATAQTVPPFSPPPPPPPEI
jgi:hypothetical protein